MICPVCQLELGVERRAEELVVTYRFGDWRPQCPCPGAPVMCSNLVCERRQPYTSRHRTEARRA